MAIEAFDLSKLATIDEGRLRVAWERELKRAREDCQDRPALDKERKVTITTILKPKCAEDGELATVDVSFDVDASIPKRSTQKYNMKPVPGGLIFNEMSPDEVRQGTLDQVVDFQEVKDA